MIVIGIEIAERYLAARAGHKGIKSRTLTIRCVVGYCRSGEVAYAGRREAIASQGEHLEGRRAVFNIKGNDYRLIAALKYQAGVLVIRFFGSHAEYDGVDAETV